MKKICCLVFLLWSISTKAHDTTRTSVNDQPNKLNTYIFMDALKDKAGDLWFATSGQGVYRYDGQSFTHFTIQDGLNDNSVRCVYEDNSGTLWFGTSNGVCRYDGKSFINFALPLPDSSGTNPRQYELLCQMPVTVNSILQDKAGNVWFVTEVHGIYRYALKNKTDEPVNRNEKQFTNFLAGNSFQCIAEDKAGNILIGSWDGGSVSRYNGKTFETFTGFSDGMIFSMLQDRSGNIWAGTRDFGVDRYDGKTIINFSQKDGLMNKNVSCLFEDSKGNIWIGSDFNKRTLKRGDAICYDGKSFTNITEKAGLLKFKDYNVRSIVEDTAGNIWLGSRDGLLIRYDGASFTDFSEKLPK